MKRLFTVVALLASFIAMPAMAHHSKTVKVGQSTSTYVKKDKAYWTRVWYKKQAAKKNGKKYRKASYTKKKRAVKRRSNVGGRVVAKVDISSQTMRVTKGGRHLYTWKVSTGRKGYSTPTGTWKIHRMHKEYYSKKYDGAPMPYAMFYHRGFAIHGTNSIKRLGRVASHGCVRLHPSNAATLFSLVRRSGGTVKVSY
ncbi:L,D-transpeptidase [Ahrensia sp. R2A130]|uniref:L,D-transpeptidase n=1 Tax=Ahrensia sp. R2A130 TaxID=744979 RepID=UPI0001E0A431|nr:L,D-transpeptidase [Ahrensia sp. R2A130]EFL90085.1 ErfK/YbiS/YcfS/YnhG [Ahrensia sp. R2A130]